MADKLAKLQHLSLVSKVTTGVCASDLCLVFAHFSSSFSQPTFHHLCTTHARPSRRQTDL